MAKPSRARVEHAMSIGHLLHGEWLRKGTIVDKTRSTAEYTDKTLQWMRRRGYARTERGEWTLTQKGRGWMEDQR